MASLPKSLNGDDKMGNMATRFFSWIVTILVPLGIIMLAVRLLMTPWFLEVEYRMPGFPQDQFGFSQADRLQWSKPSVEYLVNAEPIGFLAGLQFGDGQPIYNARELSHMADVKKVVQMLLMVWYVDIVVLVLFAIWAWKGGWKNDFILGLKRGGFLTVGLLVALAAFASISFWQFFTWFHSLFFSGNSWLFEYSDTLIRLFPIRFWQDAVAYIGVFSILSGLVFAFGLKPARK
jgi:integral membrane protein (TIGR01906 family)